MLGFAPISARPISGSPFSLTAITASLAASVTITLAVSGTPEAIANRGASVTLSFPVAGTLSVHQAISATATMTFGIEAVLRVAGKPIIVNALPQSFEVRAQMDRMTVTALPSSFTVRGDR